MNILQSKYTIIKTLKQTVSATTGKVLEETVISCTALKAVFKALGFTFDRNNYNKYYKRSLRLLNSGMALEDIITKIINDKAQEELK